MAPYPAFIRAGADIRRAAEVISVSEVGQLMVLDHDDRFVGALSEEDLVRALLPGFDDVTAAGGSLADAFALFLARGRELADRSIDPLVDRETATAPDRRPGQGRGRDARPRHPPAAGGRGRPARRHALAGRPVPGGDLPFLTRARPCRSGWR